MHSTTQVVLLFDLEVPIGCSSILSVLYCAGSATGGKGGRIKYLVLKGERVKVELYQ